MLRLWRLIRFNIIGIISAAVSAVIAIGVGLYSFGGFSQQVANIPIPDNPLTSNLQNIDTNPNNPNVDPALVNRLMVEEGLDQGTATIFAQVDTQIKTYNNTYLNYHQSLPSGESWDVVMNVIPDQTYSPTEEEILEAAASGMQVYNMSAKFYEVNNVPAMTIGYFVPYAAMSEEVLAAIKLPQEQPISAELIGVLPSAEAAGGLTGAFLNLFSIGTMIPVAGDFATSHHSTELEQLMECAQNPTNPVTRRTFEENPQERQRTIDEVRSAQSELARLSAARVLNQLAKVPGLFLHIPPVIHVVTEAASEWSEHTLQHLAEERLDQTRRAVVPCDQAPIPASGTIQYSFSRTETGCADPGHAQAGWCFERKDERTGTGTFFLTTTFGSVSGNGSGTFRQTITEITREPPDDPQADYTIGGRAVSSGEIQIDVSGVAVPSGPTRLEFRADGDSLSYDSTGTYMEGVTDVVYPTKPVHRDDYHGGFSCVFDNVDLVRGGTYEVVTEGGDGSCKLELAPA